MSDMVYADESYRIVGACFEVYNKMGSGFLESVYQESLEIELDFLTIPFVAQPSLRLAYRDRQLKAKFIPDILCYDKIIVELKAVSNLVDEYRSQVINYLHASEMKLGILVNFGNHQKLEYERFVL